MKKYIERIVLSGKKEDMDCLEDILLDSLCELKETNPEKYHKFKIKIIGMAHNFKIDKDLANEIVNDMKPKGKYWTEEQVFQLIGNQSYDMYVVMNSLANDYGEIIPLDDTDMYIELADAWIKDVDAAENKTWWYFVR